MRIFDEDLLKISHAAYFIGIGGAGMSSLARVLKYQGLTVSGSDIKGSKTTQELVREGIPVFIGQRDAHFDGSDLVIYSTAIQNDHPELRAARERGMRVRHRAELLSSIMNHAETSVAVTGTHGKTTTSSMISFVLSQLQKNPTCFIGGDILNFNTNAVLGGLKLCVAEVDESDRSHELYAPNYTVITNLEEDHLDHYRDIADLENSFMNFLSNSRYPGVVISCADDARLQAVVEKSGRPNIKYGLSAGADFRAEDIVLSPFGSEFTLVEMDLYATRVKLSIPGIHNILNALAAVAVLLQLGIEMNDIKKHLVFFRGARRRLEVKWNEDGLTVIDDYAHHPTEVKAVVAALKKMGEKVTLIFQPHRYSRTKHFYKEFAASLEGVDDLILTDIYSAGEINIAGVGVDLIYKELAPGSCGKAAVIEKDKIINYLMSAPEKRGIVAFLGAGDIGEVADEFAYRCKNFAQA